MGNNYNTPAEIMELNMKGAEGKASLPLCKMILLGILAGAFIAIGGAASSTASHGISDVGLARTVSGLIFPVGLIMTVLLGAELFTGNCLMVMSALDKRIRWSALLRNLMVVYFSNFAGALIVDVLLLLSGNLNYSGGLLGAYTIKIAVAKTAIPPVQAIASGILCNILVCIAVLLAAAAKDVTGKIMGIFFPICAFVICGFEHCVANMFYIPMGMMAAGNPDYVAAAKEAYGLTAEQIAGLNIGGLTQNLVPVTIGNMVGGMLCVGVILYVIYRKK